MKFATYRGRDGQFYWRLKARNGRIIADGSQGYASRSNAVRAVRRLQATFRRQYAS